MIKVKENRFISLVGSACIFMYVLIFAIAPRIGEDFGLTKWFTNEGIIKRMMWAFQRSEFQIMRWNARLGEQLAIFSLSMPDGFLALTSLLCIIVLIFCLSNIIECDTSVVTKFFVSSCLLFCLMPGFEVFFWKTANAGYLQTMTLTMLAIIPLTSVSALNLVKRRKSFIGLHILVCFLAGLSFENTPVAVLILIGMLVAVKKLTIRDSLLPAIALASGWFALMLAPSTAIRSAHYKKMYNVPDLSLDYIASRVHDVVKIFFSTTTPLFLVSILSVLYIVNARKMNPVIVCLIISAILVVGSMVLSPYTEARGFLYAWCVMISVTVYATCIFMQNHKNGFLLPLAAGLLSLSQLSVAYSAYSDLAFQANSREQAIINSIGKEKCNTGVHIDLYKTKYSYKYVNNRDVWFYYNPLNGEIFYGCKLAK